MNKTLKTELIVRSLALRHKIKVHESIEQPKTHEDLSVFLLAKWELEDELAAIERLLAEDRKKNVQAKTKLLEEGIIGKKRIKKTPSPTPPNGR